MEKAVKNMLHGRIRNTGAVIPDGEDDPILLHFQSDLYQTALGADGL